MGSGEWVTLLFTDIEASTDRWEDDAAHMSAALGVHDATLDAAIERHGGRRFKHTGDGMCAVFPAPAGAVQAALEAQRDLRMPVRMGLHTGEVESRDGDYFGPALNRCARIMDAGHGGQVLLSAATAALIDDVELHELGAYSLKGIERAERIFQAGDGAFAPLRVRRSSNLPAVLSSLVGRAELAAAVVDAVRSNRLVTLTGPGGVGKTRLALAAVHRLETEFDATFFIGLQEVDDDDDVLAAIARALDLHAPTSDALVTSLSQRRVLLLLDNCEHVLDGVAGVVESVAARTPVCHVVATSREGIALDGERVVPVPTLPATNRDDPAVVLFLDRARELRPDYDPDDGALDAIGSICEHLDGLPLAIELAAARTGVLSERELLDHLDERFRVLARTRRRGRDRRRTLEETVGWSYGLLDDDEQIDFARLAVFAGSFDLAAAAAVLGRDDLDTLDRLEGLVDRSLLTVDAHPTGRRYRYLETIRAYAEDRLHETGDPDGAFGALHAHYAAALPALVEHFADDMRPAASRLERDAPNLRRAFEWTVDRGDLTAATTIVRPMLPLAGRVVWPIHGWADEALALQDAAGSVEEPVLLVLQVVDRWLVGRFRDVADTVRRALALEHMPRPLPDDLFTCVAFQLDVVNRYDECEELIAERRATGCATALDVLERQFHRLKAGEPLDAVVARTNAEAGQLGRAHAAFLRAVALCYAGPSEALQAAVDEALGLFPEGSGFWFYTIQLEMVGELSAGDHAAALEIADTVLEHAYRIGDRSAMVTPLVAYAVCAQQLGEPEVAAILRGRLPGRMTVMFEQELIDLDEWLWGQLDDSGRSELAVRGAGMEPQDLRDLAREVIDRYLAAGD